jgi:predicted O-methyltransferase YrrM
MPDEEGLALAAAAGFVAARPELPGVIVEVGAYCGRSALYLASGLSCAAEERRLPPARPPVVVFSLDHHHGSEENQSGWEHHDPNLVDPATGRFETLSSWRAAVDEAGVADMVVGIVGDSATVASAWQALAGMVFIDGGHGAGPAWSDYHGWAPHVAVGGLLLIHDVFPDPRQGGRPPYELYLRAMASRAFEELPELCEGSLRALRRVGPGK